MNTNLSYIIETLETKYRKADRESIRLLASDLSMAGYNAGQRDAFEFALSMLYSLEGKE